MPIEENEALACLEVLVAMMKADGKIDPAEKKSLAAALDAFDLPPVSRASAEHLLEGKIDVDSALSKITSDEGREQAYRSTYFMAHADGRCGQAEADLLARVEAALKPSDAQKARLAQLFGGKPKGKTASLLDAVGGLFRKKS
jgi:tellurite resistance protein